MTVLAPYGFTTGGGAGTDDCDERDDGEEDGDGGDGSAEATDAV
ncbi:MAG: hypothetical protein ABEJ26_03570 [Halosimplex sp.]